MTKTGSCVLVELFFKEASIPTFKPQIVLAINSNSIFEATSSVLLSPHRF